MKFESPIPNTIDNTKKDITVPFDPKDEFKYIKNIENRDDRKDSLERFKEDFAYQKIGFANLKKEIYEVVSNMEEESYDGGWRRVYLLVDEYKDKYRFTEKQSESIRKILGEVREKRSFIESFLEKYKYNAREVFKAIYKKYPVGEVEIRKGVLSIDFICDEEDDYAVVYSGDFGEEKDESKIKEINKIKEQSKHSLGCFTHKSPRNIPQLENSIIGAIRYSKDIYGILLEETIKHEELHSINSLYKGKFFDAPYSFSMEGFKFLDKIDKKDKEEQIKEVKNFIKSWVRESLSFYFEYLKDEIMAYSLEGSNMSVDLITNILSIKNPKIKSQKDSELYNYFDVNDFGNAVSENIKLSGGLNITDRNSLENFTKEYVMSFYAKKIQRGAQAIRGMQELGLDDQSIIGLLMSEPLESWRKIYVLIEKQIKKDPEES